MSSPKVKYIGDHEVEHSGQPERIREVPINLNACTSPNRYTVIPMIVSYRDTDSREARPVHAQANLNTGTNFKWVRASEIMRSSKIQYLSKREVISY